jgi:hypothetical protein
MNIIGLDDVEYKWKYHLYQTQKSNASKPHIRARELLKKLYPFASISEEVPLVGTFKVRLVLDFYIHIQQLAIEVQGQQHYKFNSHFYQNKQAFCRAQSRDRSKIEWCKINNIDLVELPDNESNEQWEQRIRDRGSFC